MTLREATRAAGEALTGPIIATHTMPRMRITGEPGAEEVTIENVVIEISTPQEQHLEDYSSPLWTCSLRVSEYPRLISITGNSSLGAIINAAQAAAAILRALPYASEIDASMLPNFGLPFSCITTPEQLIAEQERAERVRLRYEEMQASR